MIVVTGAGGHVGRLVAEDLARRGEPMRLLVRDPSRAPDVPGAVVVQADYGDAASLDCALEPGDRVFMVSLHEGPAERVPHHLAFVEACVRREVEQVVYLSFVNAGPDAIFLHARSHGATEQALRESSLRWAAIRNGMYADHMAGWFDPDGVAREAGGDGRMSFSYRRELAEAIAVVLTEPGHDGVLNVTTPESVTLAELAQLASEVTGREYRYEPASDEAWDERWRELGREGWELEAGHSSYAALRAGEFDVVGSDFERLTGKEPLSIRTLLELLVDELPLR